jgi:hypothetical protein
MISKLSQFYGTVSFYLPSTSCSLNCKYSLRDTQLLDNELAHIDPQIIPDTRPRTDGKCNPWGNDYCLLYGVKQCNWLQQEIKWKTDTEIQWEARCKPAVPSVHPQRRHPWASHALLQGLQCYTQRWSGGAAAFPFQGWPACTKNYHNSKHIRSTDISVHKNWKLHSKCENKSRFEVATEFNKIVTRSPHHTAE